MSDDNASTGAPSMSSVHRDTMRVSRKNRPYGSSGTMSPFALDAQNDAPSRIVTAPAPTGGASVSAFHPAMSLPFALGRAGTRQLGHLTRVCTHVRHAWGPTARG